MLGGGVSANAALRKQLQEKLQQEMPHVQCIIPDAALSTDNALMIAVAGYFHRTETLDWKHLQADANWRIGT
jgi:tRNA A37 threonylcarbamoyltransferase TsaD